MKHNQIKRAKTATRSVLGLLLLAMSAPVFAQSCPVNPPATDVLLFVDNSGSISNVEFDAAQQAIANIATEVLSRPGFRLAAVNWACREAGDIDSSRDGCRIDLATGSAIAGGWSSNPAQFAYVGNNSSSNRVCRSFGNTGSGEFLHRNNCGGANFTAPVASDFAQHALKVLEGAMYSGGGTGGTDSNGAATVAPGAPSTTSRLMVIHMTDANAAGGSRIRQVPVAESALGDYYYSNRFKNVRNALMVGVGIDSTASTLGARQQLGALSSRGGASADYDISHQTVSSTAAVDIGTPRLATFSATYNAAQILAATNSALNATIPACVVLRKQSVGGVGSFNFTGGTNGLPNNLTLTTTVVGTPVASPAYTLPNFNTDTGIQETIPAGWEMSGASCVNASNVSVPANVNTSTGQITIPGAQITAGAQLTCTVTNTRVQPNFGTCDARMFMDQTDAAQTLSTLNNVNYGTTPFTFTALGPASLARNGIGYNQVDNYIYGIEWVGASGNELIRVASNGSSTNLGVITGLPASNYNNGAISPAGEYYVMSGFGGTTLYRVNLTTRVATSITLSSSIQVSDFAWYNGLLWAVNSGGTLVSVNPTSGAVTSIGSTTPVGTALAMWGFNNGLFASGGGSIHAIDPATGAATLLSAISPATSNGDGANCPGANIQFNADLSVTKTNTPALGPNDLPTDTYNAGEVRTYTIVVTNGSSSFGAQNITVSDPIPAGITASTVSWTCASTSGGARCGAASGTGALNDTGLDLPPSAVATYTVTMTVPTTFTGDLSNTVTITPPSTINDANTANNTATDVDQPTARLTIVKSVPSGQGTAFDFSQSGMPATATGSPNAATATTFSLNPSVVSGSNLTATQTYTNVPPSTAITVNELRSSNISQYSLVNIACTNAAGTPAGSTFPTSINNAASNGSPVGTATITLVPGAHVTCTFNNVRNPRIVIVKNTVGGDGTFSFSETSSAAGTSLSPASPINLVTSGGSATVNTTIAGLSGAATTNVTITEAVTAGFTLSSINCTNLTTGIALTTGTTPSATVTLASRQVVLGTVATGSEVQCTFVNTRNAQLQLRKTWVNARINDAVNIPATSGFATNTTAFSSVANTANESDSGTAVNVLVGATGTLPTENFTTGSAGNYTTTGWECRDGSTTLNVAQGGSLTIPASSAGTTLVCTLTNTRRQATLALSKTWVNAVVNDTASLQSSGGVNTATLASVANNANETDTGATVAVFAGEVLTLSETLGAGNVGVYGASAWSCTGTTGLSGSTLTVAGADAAIVCRITNTRASANLSITKTSTTSPVSSGGTITYSIVATNNGPSAADNAVVSEDWTTLPGLDCSTATGGGTATCAASGTAGTQCPATVTPESLQAGALVPVFPSGGILTFSLQCRVTATGQ